MNVSRWTLLVLFLGGVLNAPTWGGNCLMYMYDPAHTGYTDEELPGDLALHWKFTTGEDDRHSAPPVVYGDRIFYCANGIVYALDAQTGSVQWRYPKEVELKEQRRTPTGGFMAGIGAGMGAGMGTPAETSTPVDRLAPIRVSPALDPEGRILYVGADDGSLYALNAENGKLLKQFKAGGAIRSAPTLEGGVLYFGANDRHVYAVDAKSLELAWQEPMYVGDIVNQPICLTPESMAFTTAGGTTFVVDRQTLQQRWRRRYGYTLAPPIVVGDLVYIAADGEVQARRRKSESLGWKFQTPSQANIMASLSMAHGSLYVASQDTFVYVLRSQDGTELWRQSTGMDPDVWEKLKASHAEEIPGGGLPTGVAWLPPEAFQRVKGYRVRAAPTISGKDLWIGTEGGFVVRLNALTGEPQWLYKLSPEETTGEGAPIYNVLAPPVVANGALYICTDDSTLYCFRPDAVDVGAPRVRDEEIITKARDESEVSVPIYEQTIVEQFPEDQELRLELRSQYPFRFYAVLSDEGSGIRQGSLEVWFDGQRIEALKYNTATGELVAELMAPPPPGSRVQPQLEDGEHTIQLKVSDWRGNTTTRSWQFHVDNTLPPLEPSERTERTGPAQGVGQGIGQGGRRQGSRGGQGGGMGPGGGMGGGGMGPGGGMGGGRMY